MSACNWDYSEYADILHIHKKNHRTKGSVELGDFTLDFDSQNEVVGIEVEHASQFFENVGIDKVSLKNIQEAQFIIDKRNPQSQVTFLQLKLVDGTKKIPLPLPVVA